MSAPATTNPSAPHKRLAQRILICFHDFSRGGTERIAIGMAAYWVNAGRDVTILCGTTEGGLRDSVDARVQVVALNPPVRRSTLSRIKLGREMGKRIVALAPDLVFLPGNFHIVLSGAIHAADPRLAIVSKISNPPVPHWLAPKLGRWVVRRFSRYVDGFAAMNSGLTAELRTMLPGRAIETVFDPIYIDPKQPTPRRAPENGRVNVLWAGRLEPQKDVSLALHTIKTLIKRRPAHLTVLGDGALLEQAVRQIKTLGLETVVTLAGHVPSIDPYLAQADVLLISSYYEGGPAVAVEALAYGVPIVSTDCSHFLHDIMTVPEAGKIVMSRKPEALADAIVDVCTRSRPDPALFAPLIAHLEPEACAQAYLNWFDTIVTNRAAHSA
jgi:glycosyltransferase involved in cell wall biosynthesis